MKQKKVLIMFLAIMAIEVCFILFSWNVSYCRNPYLIINVDNLASAGVARNIVDGKGYTTDSLSLYEVALYDKKGWLSEGPPWKNTYRFPLPILSMALLFKVFQNSHFVANFLYPSIFHFLSVAALFGLTYLMFRNGTIAFIASLLFITNHGILFTMLNKSESADIFFFILSLMAFFAWGKKPGKRAPLILGLTIGLLFLNRFNEGAILFITYLIVLFKSKKLTGRATAFYLTGFLIPIVPFLFHNVITLGTLFFSSNSYFQFIDNSIVSKYMNPWWKLNYSIDIMRPFTYFSLYPADFFMKAVYYVQHYTMPNLLNFRGSIWWWVPLLYALLKKNSDPTIKTLVAIFSSTLILHVFLVAPLGLNIRYLQFLFVPLILIIAKTIHEWCASVVEAVPGPAPDRNAAAAGRHIPGEVILLSISACIIPVSLHSIASLNVFIVIIVLTVAAVVISLARKSVRLVLLQASCLLIISAVIWADDRYKMFDIKALTVEDPAVLKNIEETTKHDQIILATHFWNPAWFSKRPSLPVPEYPDEIYLLMKKFNLNVAALYLSHVDTFVKHVHPRIPLAYHSYLRLTRGKIPLRGFTREGKSLAGGLLLYRDNDPLADILDTKEIDFGKNEANSHLVYGFSFPVHFDNSKVCWVLNASELQLFDKQKYAFSENGALMQYDNPDAEITFLKNDVKPLSHIKIQLFNFNEGETVTVVLNSNLFSYGDKGFLLSRIRLKKGWNSIDLRAGKYGMRQGVNKLSFWFKEKRSLQEFSQDALTPEERGGAQDLLSIAFSKVHFEFSGERTYK